MTPGGKTLHIDYCMTWTVPGHCCTQLYSAGCTVSRFQEIKTTWVLSVQSTVHVSVQHYLRVSLFFSQLADLCYLSIIQFKRWCRIHNTSRSTAAANITLVSTGQQRPLTQDCPLPSVRLHAAWHLHDTAASSSNNTVFRLGQGWK